MQTTLMVHDHDDGEDDAGVVWAVTSMTMIGFLVMDTTAPAITVIVMMARGIWIANDAVNVLVVQLRAIRETISGTTV